MLNKRRDAAATQSPSNANSSKEIDRKKLEWMGRGRGYGVDVEGDL
jgi:hypothetical protein